MSILCPECNSPISDGVSTCPNCGFPLAEGETKQLKAEAVEEFEASPATVANDGDDNGDDKIEGASLDVPALSDGGAASSGQPESNSATEEKPVGFCPKCGNPVNADQAYCGNCGFKLIEKRQTADEHKHLKKDTSLKVPKLPKGALKIALAACVVAIVAIFVVPALTVSTDDLLLKGDFEGAYAKASGDKAKADVLALNHIATLCPDVVDSLKDGDSFELRQAWFDPSECEIVLKVSGANSMGGTVSNYWYYTLDEDEGTFSLYTTVSDLEEEEIYEYADEWDEKLEKALNNVAKGDIGEIISDDELELPKGHIKAINALFEEDKLDDVALIDAATKLAPKGETDA